MRIDKLLWFLRLTRTRAAAKELVEGGLVRINARRITRPAQEARPGDVLVLPLDRGLWVIELLALPSRRGPASEAQSCYRVLDERAANPIAQGQNTNARGDRLP